MAEKMLMTQALDERDLLVNKISDKIVRLRLVDTKKKNEEKTMEDRVTPEQFERSVQSAWQQVMDLIDRYQRLDSAIIASNASNWVETSSGRYTVASAIALRARLKGNGIYEHSGKFEERLVMALEDQYNSAVRTAAGKNKAIEAQAENMRLSILGKDSKTKDVKPLEVVDAYIRENTTDIVDPLDAKKKQQEIREKLDTLLSELDTVIKASNATTTIEF